MTATTTSEAEAPAQSGGGHRPLLGMLLVVGATMLFAGNDAVNKYLLASYDVPLVAATRYIIHALLMIILLAPRHGRQMVETTRTGLVVIRGVCLAVGSLFAGLALQRMPIAETTAIIYLSPIMVVLLARPVLGEQIGLLGWLAALGGFVGVLLIVRPGAGLDPLGVTFALCNIGVTAAYYLLSRVLARTERTLALLFYSALAGAILFGLAAPWYWFGTMPGTLDLLLFLSLGVTAGLGHYMFTAANRYAEASKLAPMTYLHLLWAAMLGWLVFSQVPDALGLVGMGIIGLGGVISALRSRRARD